MHVLVIGGGIGGLCLAQGLKQAGVSVAVYERDRTRTDRLQGYRIHISPAGSRALHECLPPELFDAFVATTGRVDGGFSFLTEQLRPLLRIGGGAISVPVDPADAHHSVSRITLRQVLLAGLADTGGVPEGQGGGKGTGGGPEGQGGGKGVVVHFDKEFQRYEQRADGTVRAHFADGSEAVGDVLVAADGGRSRVRRQYLPHAGRVDTGIAGIAGKLALTERTRPMIPEPLRGGVGFIANAPQGHTMFLATQEFDRRRIPVPAGAGAATTAPGAPTVTGTDEVAGAPTVTGAGVAVGGDDEAAATHPGLLFDNTSDYLMWGFCTLRERYPVAGPLESLDNPALHELTQRMIRDWHPDLRRLVAESDPSTITLLPIHTSTPVEPWPASNVTLVGDAIHSMTPFQGIGANVALRDAALLCSRLVAAGQGELPLLRAIGEYEHEMRGYGFDAVRRSLDTAHRATSASPLARIAGRAFLRLVDRVPAMKRRFLTDV